MVKNVCELCIHRRNCEIEKGLSFRLIQETKGIDDMAMLYGRKEDVVSITCNGIPMFTQIGFVKGDSKSLARIDEIVTSCKRYESIIIQTNRMDEV